MPASSPAASNSGARQSRGSATCPGSPVASGSAATASPNQTPGRTPRIFRRPRRADGSDYLLNGEKIWITNGNMAHLAIVFATRDRSARHKGSARFWSRPRRQACAARRCPASSWVIAHPTTRTSRSRTAGFRPARCWASQARASRSPCRRWIAGASVSRRALLASVRRAWTPV